MRGVGVADAQHLAELVVRHRDRHRGAARRRVLDAAQPDLGVAARDGLIDRVERHEHELRRPAEAAREQIRDLDVEAHEHVGIVGLASTYGAPPSGSPAQRNGGADCAAADAAAPASTRTPSRTCRSAREADWNILSRT